MFEVTIPLLSDCNELLVRFLRATQVSDVPFEVVYVVLGPLTNGTLSFAIVRSLTLQLRRGQRGDAPRACTRCAFLARNALLLRVRARGRIIVGRVSLKAARRGYAVGIHR